MAFATKAVATWTVSDVGEYLDQLELTHLKPAFKENAVSGGDLLSLTEEDFVNDLNLTKLQYRKIKTGLEALQGAAGDPTAVPKPATEPSKPEAAVGYPMPAAPVPAAYPPAQGAPPPGYPTSSPYGAPPNTGAGAPVPGAPVYTTGAGGSAGGSGIPPQNRAQAGKLLETANAQLMQALEAVKSAQKTAGGMMAADVIAMRPRPFMGPLGRGGRFGPNPMMTVGNVAANSAENAKLEKADMLANQAAQYIEQAQQLVPQIPSIDMAGVKQLKKGIAGAVLAPGLSQAMRAGQIGKQASALQTTITQVQSAQRWLANMQ